MLRIRLGFPVGTRFLDQHQVACPVHRTVLPEWEHLRFFEHRCVLACRVPRIKNSDGKVTTVVVPWARPSSGCTLLFEAFGLLLLAFEMPVSILADVLDVYAKRVWTVCNYGIKKQCPKIAVKV